MSRLPCVGTGAAVRVVVVSLALMGVFMATCVSVFIFVSGWALTPVFVRYMSGAYDPYTQAFVRYASAAVVLVVYSAFVRRDELLRALRMWRVLLPMSLLITVMQLAWTIAIYHTTATMAQLVTTLQAPLVILLSFLLFHDERNVIRSPLYLSGTVFCVVGVAGVFMRDIGGTIRIYIDLALLLLLFVSVSWSVYAVWGRHTARGLPPIPMFTVLSIYVSIAFIIPMIVFGNPGTLWSAGARMNGIAFVSGVICIAAAHCAFHYAQVRLGSSFCTSIQLLSPFITHLIALTLWPDERLLWIQWAGGLLLITGSFMVIRAKWLHRNAVVS